MDTGEISKTINQLANHDLFPFILLSALLVVVAFMLRRRIKTGWLNLKTRLRLGRLGYAQLLKKRCPDGLGYHFDIDCLILRQDGISLLMTMNYPGKIFCAENIDDWTQMIGQKSFRFKNPYYDLECQVKAVTACVPGVPVNGFLLFGHQSEFPKGHPDWVIHLDHLPQQLKRDKKRDVEPSVKSAWEKLKAMPG